MAQEQTGFWAFDVEKLMEGLKVPGLEMDQLVSTQRKNIEAVTAANKLAVEAMQAVAKRQSEILKQTLEESAAAMRELTAAGAPPEKIARQAELTKEAFEKNLANLKELSEMVGKSNAEAMDLISKRISEILDEVKAAAKK